MSARSKLLAAAALLAIVSFLAGYGVASRAPSGGVETGPGAAEPADTATGPTAAIPDSVSLVQLPHLPFQGFDDLPTGEDDIARGTGELLRYLESSQAAHLEDARAAFQRLGDAGRLGPAEEALAWLADFLALPEGERAERLRDDPVLAFYVDFWSAGDFGRLKLFLTFRYGPDAQPPAPGDGEWDRFVEVLRGDGWTFTTEDPVGALEDLLVMNNPTREAREASDEHLAALALAPGQVVVDVGSGPGHFSFKFADGVGETGRVHALDIVPVYVEYLERAAGAVGVGSIEARVSEPADIGVAEGVADLVFLHSVYRVSYLGMPDEARAGFAGSIRRAMKPDGKLVIVENDPRRTDHLDDGPRIAPDLIAGQLAHYGFRLEGRHQFVPERYMLVFSPE